METVVSYEEFLEELGLARTELSSLIYSLYQQALRDGAHPEDPNSGRIYRDF